MQGPVLGAEVPRFRVRAVLAKKLHGLRRSPMQRSNKDCSSLPFTSFTSRQVRVTTSRRRNARLHQSGKRLPQRGSRDHHWQFRDRSSAIPRHIHTQRTQRSRHKSPSDGLLVLRRPKAAAETAHQTSTLRPLPPTKAQLGPPRARRPSMSWPPHTASWRTSPLDGRSLPLIRGTSELPRPIFTGI